MFFNFKSIINLISLFFIINISFLFSFDNGLPKPTGTVIYKSNYALQYNEKFEQADWVYYKLTKEMVMGQTPRKDSFKSDPEIETGSASLGDYKGSGYDRGHLVPAADMKMSPESMNDSFFMSNMSPQKPGFNRGIWVKLEKLVRELAIENHELFVVTGPVFTNDDFETIGENNVGVPQLYYKVLLDYYGDEIKSIGFLLPNEKSSLPLIDFVISVNDIEDLTGIDFFYQLPDHIEEDLETTVDLDLWSF